MSRAQILQELTNRGVDTRTALIRSEIRKRGVDPDTGQPLIIESALAEPQDRLQQFVTRPLARTARAAVSGTLGAAADLARLVTDPITGGIATGLTKFGFEEAAEVIRPPEILPSQQIRQAFDVATGGLTAPRTPAERVTDIAAETVASGGLGLLGRAGGAARQFLTPQTTQQLAALGGAGAGAGIAEEVAPESIIAPIAGGLAGGLAAGRLASIRAPKQADATLTAQQSQRLIERGIGTQDKEVLLKQLKDSPKITILPDVAGDEIRGLTRQVAKFKGDPRRLITDALEGRSKEAETRILNQLTKRISGVDTYFGNIDEISAGRSAASRPLYEEAFIKGRQLKISKRLNTLLNDQRIQTAITDAKTNLGVRLEAPNNSLEVLDGAKKSIDDIIGQAKRVGQDQRAASFLILKKNLTEELDRQVPVYKKARKVFSSFSDFKSAQEEGLQFTKRTDEQIRRLVKDMTPGELDSYRIGVREALQRVVANTPEGADPAKRIFAKGVQKRRLRAIFDTETEFNQFSKRMRAEIDAADTKAKVIGGSRTDFNVIDDAQFIDAAETAVREGRLGITRQAVDAVAGAIKRRYVGLNEKNAKELTNILLSKERSVEVIQNIIAKEKNVAQKSILRDFFRDRAQGILRTLPEAGRAAIITENQ